MGLAGRNGYYVPLVYVVKSQPLVSNAYFQYMHTWFDAQLDQKILDGL